MITNNAGQVSVLAERPAGELFYRYTFVVTSFSKKIPSKEVINAYKRCGLMENDIKEAENGFFMGKTDSTKFQANRASCPKNLLQSFDKSYLFMGNIF